MTRRSDRGITLVETVVAVGLLALVGVTLAAAFTVVVRTVPSAEDRADDARSLLGLTNWIPQDVASTELRTDGSDGITIGDTTPNCAPGSIPATGSQGLLELEWTEGTTTYITNYRFDDTSAGRGEIVRYSCAAGQSAVALSLTPPLEKVPAGPDPNQAPAPINIDPATSATGQPGVDFVVRVIDEDGVSQRDLLSLDAFTTNVHTTLPTTTTPPTTVLANQPPVAADLYITAALDEVVNVTLPASDAELDPLTASFLTPPSQIVTTGPGIPTALDATIQASSADGAVEGGIYPFFYQVDDGVNPPTVAYIELTVDSAVSPATTSTSTTTTTVTCSANFAAVVPNPITLRPNGRMDTDLVVTISTNGACAPLVMTFSPDSGLPVQQEEFLGLPIIVIPANAYRWNAADAPYTLELRQGAAGAVLDTATLGVAP